MLVTPEYRLRLANASVRHFAVAPIFVRYAVDESEQTVLILKFQAVPGSTLDQ